MARLSGVSDQPSGMSAVVQQFACWRAKRRRGERIPESLWQLAEELAVQHGINQTSDKLGLDYYQLQRRLKSRANRADAPVPVESRSMMSAPRFLELPAILSANTSCVIEIEEVSGRKLRIELPATQANEILTAIGLHDPRDR